MSTKKHRKPYARLHKALSLSSPTESACLSDPGSAAVSLTSTKLRLFFTTGAPFGWSRQSPRRSCWFSSGPDSGGKQARRRNVRPSRKLPSAGDRHSRTKSKFLFLVNCPELLDGRRGLLLAGAGSLAPLFQF